MRYRCGYKQGSSEAVRRGCAATHEWTRESYRWSMKHCFQSMDFFLQGMHLTSKCSDFTLQGRDFSIL
jgi:hypothetical protein